MFYLFVGNPSWLEIIEPSLFPSKKRIPYSFLSEYLQRIRDLEDKTEIQRRQIKDLEEKVAYVSFSHAKIRL